jgi:hypothetical protein
MQKSMFVASVLVLASGCAANGADDEAADGGSGSSSDADAGAARTPPRLQVLLTDAPGDFEHVWVNIASVAIESGGQWLSLAATPQRFDLLVLQNDVTAALGGATLAPGTYGQLRLIVDSASVVVAGQESPLTIASGTQTGIKINLGATLEENMSYAVTLDFDAARSVKATGHGYLMTPVIEIKALVGTDRKSVV